MKRKRSLICPDCNLPVEPDTVHIKDNGGHVPPDCVVLKRGQPWVGAD